MPDWKLPDEIEKDAEGWIKLMHSLAGIYMCVFPSLPLPLVDLSLGTNGSSPSNLSGILSPERRGSVGLWSVLLPLSSIECSNISVQIFYFANRYLLLFAMIGM
jgi:hypothetical protein